MASILHSLGEAATAGLADLARLAGGHAVHAVLVASLVVLARQELAALTRASRKLTVERL